MLIKLLKDYADFKIGEVCDTANDADGQTLIDDGIAEKHIVIEKAAEIKTEEIVSEVKKAIAEEVKELKIPAQPKSEDGIKSIYPTVGHFFKDIMGKQPKERLLNYYKSSGMSAGVDSDGGYAIPTEFSLALLEALNQQSVIAPKCMNFPINSYIELPYVNNWDQSSSWTGGVQVYKNGEGVATTASKPALGKAALKLKKMSAAVYATEELIADSPIALGSFLQTMVATELALTKDEDIINGTGVSEALGIIDAPCTIDVTKETGQAATTIELANVLKMWKTLSPMSRSKAVWLVNQDCIDQIMTMNLVVGTGGAPVMLVNAATSLPQSILGAPIIYSPHCQTLGTSGDIILADFSQYITATKAGSEIDTQTSIHVKFLEGETTFRFTTRFDGQPWWSTYITPKHGTNYVSPFVTLADRS